MPTRTLRSRSQRGEGRLGLVIALLVVASVIYLLVKFVPLRVQKAELGDFIESRTREAMVQQHSMQHLTDAIVAEWAKEGVTITEDAISIMESEQRIRVDVRYDVTVKLVGGKEIVRHFDISKEVPKL